MVQFFNIDQHTNIISFAIGCHCEELNMRTRETSRQIAFSPESLRSIRQSLLLVPIGLVFLPLLGVSPKKNSGILFSISIKIKTCYLFFKQIFHTVTRTLILFQIRNSAIPRALLLKKILFNNVSAFNPSDKSNSFGL